MRVVRIWSETVSFDALGSARVIDLLRRYRLRPLLAVRPGDLPGLRALLPRYREAGIAPGLWPMLADADGRWVNTRNVERFVGFVRAVMREAEGQPIPEVAFDLEPSIDWLKALIGDGGRWRPGGASADRGHMARTREQLRDVIAELKERGVASLAAVMPVVPLDGQTQGWQGALGTPVDGLAFEHLSVMTYTSLLEGWSRGTVRRRDARAMLAASAVATLERFKASGGLSIGTVGIGALGTEPFYRGPEELAEDVGIARACGVEELALHDLGGVLARPPAEAWLDALVNTPAAAVLPQRTLRVRALLTGLRVATSVLGLLVRSG